MTKKSQIIELVHQWKTNDEIAAIIQMNRHDLCKIIRNEKKRLGIYNQDIGIDVKRIKELYEKGDDTR